MSVRLRLRITCMVALCAILSSTALVLGAGIAAACSGAGGGGCTTPTASTGSASSITSNSATLSGSVNAQGCTTYYAFEWGKSSSGPFPDSIEGSAGKETSPKPVSTNLTGLLQPSTQYYFRLSAFNSEGKEATGSVVPFKTPAACAKPTVTTNTPASVKNTSALLSGSVNTNGCQTTTKIEWGPSTSPGTYPNSVNGPSGTGTLSPSYTVSGLQPNTGYHYRVSANNSTTGTTSGADKPFTTLKTKYVALGDSFSSGVGTGTYYTPDPENCKRSMYSYPELLHNAHPDWSFVNATCLGATISWLKYEAAKNLSQDVNWVTYTIGGNDADFPWVMFDCAIVPEAECIYLIEIEQEYILHTLPGELDEVNNLIKSKAGNAKVIVLDYPRLFGETSFCISPYNEGIRTLMNGTANLMKGVISNATARAGANFVFRDVIPSFVGHAVCDGGTKWLNGVVTLSPSESYHPTIEGQSNGYYPAVHGVTG